MCFKVKGVLGNLTTTHYFIVDISEYGLYILYKVLVQHSKYQHN